MYLKQLSVHGLRNLIHSQLNLSPGANLLYGANGSGKTSVLEAIYLLGRGRSFRTRNLRSVINHQADQCTVYGIIANPENSKVADIPIGVSRSRGGQFKFKISGEPVHNASRLIDQLPLQLMNAESFQLLEGSPQNRRRLIDWGVFHVEHRYRDLWSRYQRSLKQRNSLLRHAKIDRLHLAVWDREFSDLAENITAFRQQYLDTYLPLVKKIASEFEIFPEPELRFYPGWDTRFQYPDVLSENFDRDRAAGRTSAGPHRADLQVILNGKPATEVLSRGQTKVMVSLLLIAQGYAFRQSTGQNCVYLLDDLPAELDRRNRIKTGELLESLHSQVFITGVEEDNLKNTWPSRNMDGGDVEARMFHVEHGKIIQVAGN